jgi:hypothetical protein
MSELGTGTGFSETVAWVVAAAVAVAFVAAVLARGEAFSSETCELVSATAEGAPTKASSTTAVRTDERTRRE